MKGFLQVVQLVHFMFGLSIFVLDCRSEHTNASQLLTLHLPFVFVLHVYSQSH